MKLRTDNIGHFDNPTEDNISAAVVYSGEGADAGDIVKLMIDDENFLSIWIGSRLTGHKLTHKSFKWKLDSAEKLPSEKIIELMIKYLHGDLTPLSEIQWARPAMQTFLDNCKKLQTAKIMLDTCVKAHKLV